MYIDPTTHLRHHHQRTVERTRAADRRRAARAVVQASSSPSGRRPTWRPAPIRGRRAWARLAGLPAAG